MEQPDFVSVKGEKYQIIGIRTGLLPITDEYHCVSEDGCHRYVPIPKGEVMPESITLPSGLVVRYHMNKEQR